MSRVIRYLFFMMPGFVAGAAAFLLLLRRRRRGLAARGMRSGMLREGAICLFWMYCGGMAVITLCPEPGWLYDGLRFGVWSPYFDASALAHRMNLLPFSQGDSLFNLVGNVVMFLPFGFFAALLWRGFAWRRAALMGLGITASIECWQTLTGRYFDIDDILLNALGVFCGYLLWRCLRRAAPNRTARFQVIDNMM